MKMEKKTYVRPSMKIVRLRHRVVIMAGSTPPNEIKDYDDWLGSKGCTVTFEDDEEE